VLLSSCSSAKKRLTDLQALTSLGCMEHRGACSADDDSGDGAGIMTQIPWDLFKADLPDLNSLTTGCAHDAARHVSPGSLAKRAEGVTGLTGQARGLGWLCCLPC